jgi:hypothetical protein
MRSISKIRLSVKRDFREWLEYTHQQLLNFPYRARPKIVCYDGFTMSVQGGIGSYSTPRQFVNNFSKMEIGYPSHFEELIHSYAETDDYTHTIYPYVPVSLIIEVIEKHGGMKKN